MAAPGPAAGSGTTCPRPGDGGHRVLRRVAPSTGQAGGPVGGVADSVPFLDGCSVSHLGPRWFTVAAHQLLERVSPCCSRSWRAAEAHGAAGTLR